MNEGNQLMWLMNGLQAVILLLVGWIKLDIQQLWKRVNSHGHKIDCDGEKCKPKTTAVIVHEE
jgi:hypothetical protein